MTKERMNWNDRIRRAISTSGLSLYAVARDSGVNVAPLQRFMAGEHGLTVDSAEKIGRIVGLDLGPVPKGTREK